MVREGKFCLNNLERIVFFFKGYVFFKRELFYDFNKKLGRGILDLDYEEFFLNWGNEGIIKFYYVIVFVLV